MAYRGIIATIPLLLAGCVSEGRVRERSVTDALREGIAFLVRTQNGDGSWGHAGDTTGFDVWAPGPGSHHAFKVATTALCVIALENIAAEERAYRRGLEFLLEHIDVRRHDGVTMYNTWAHAYAIQALAGAYRQRRDERYAEAIRSHIVWLQRYETMYGGWNYFDFNAKTQRPSSGGTSFGTGAAMVALLEARAIGIEVPERMVERALHLLQLCRKPDGSYLYGYDFRWVPVLDANQDKGSLGRAQAPNCALWMSGRLVGPEDVQAGLNVMFQERKFLECGRKRQIPHEAYYQNSGYYYYFGHYYAARLISELPAADRERYTLALLSGILPFQEADGSWWDYRMYGYHKPYGTALAIMAIRRVASSQ